MTITKHLTKQLRDAWLGTFVYPLMEIKNDEYIPHVASSTGHLVIFDESAHDLIHSIDDIAELTSIVHMPHFLHGASMEPYE